MSACRVHTRVCCARQHQAAPLPSSCATARVEMGEIGLEDFDVYIVGGDARNRRGAEEAMESTSLISGGSDGKLDQKKFAGLKKLLMTLPAGTPEATRPSANNDGTMSGWLLHQGKMRGKWKKGWFVLKPPFLFQYASDSAHPSSPKNSFYVAYAMAERVTDSEVADQALDDAQKLNALEERACSLRLTVYTGTKLKVLSATSDETLEQWVSALEASVQEHTTPALLEEKHQAAQELKPLLTAQLLREVDLYRVLYKNISDSGLLAADVDPMLSKRKAKGGKLWMLKYGRDMSEEISENFLYFCIVDSFMYFYKEVVPVDDYYETDNAFFGDAGGGITGSGEAYSPDQMGEGFKWKGCINLKLAKVGMAPKEVLSDHRRANSIMIVTPLRTYVLVAMHELSAEDWMMQITAAQQGVALKDRKSRMNLIDVHNDPIAAKVSSATPLPCEECLRHQVTNFYFSKYVEKQDSKLGPSLLIFKEFAKLKRLSIQDLVVVKALKIRDQQMARSEWFSDEVRAQLDAQLDKDEESIGLHSYKCIEDALTEGAQKYYEGFKASKEWKEMMAACGPKYLEVTRADDKKYLVRRVLDGELIIGRGDPRDDGRQYLQLWREGDDSRISREHCKLDAGKMALLVTDLGSSNATRYTPGAAGRVIKLDHLPPGGALYLGEYILTYKLGVCPKGRTSLVGKMLGKR
jgi:hypothetical protein